MHPIRGRVGGNVGVVGLRASSRKKLKQTKAKKGKKMETLPYRNAPYPKPNWRSLVRRWCADNEPKRNNMETKTTKRGKMETFPYRNAPYPKPNWR